MPNNPTPPYECACGARYSTPSAAETCAEQDDLEDRATRSVYRRSK